MTGPTGSTGATGPGGSSAFLPIVMVEPPVGATTPVLADTFSIFNMTNGGSQTALFPAANSVPNGTALAIKVINIVVGSSLGFTASVGNTIDGFSTIPNYLVNSQGAALAISDGVNGWWLIRDSGGT